MEKTFQTLFLISYEIGCENAFMLTSAGEGNFFNFRSTVIRESDADAKQKQ